MKPHPLIRKTAKWGGAALTIALLGLWLASALWNFGWQHGWKWEVFAHRGVLVVHWTDPTLFAYGSVSPPTGWFHTKRYGDMQWRFDHIVAYGEQYVHIPLWFLPIVPAAVAGFAWRRDAQVTRGERGMFCRKCRYPRAGLPATAPCPECGHNAVNT